MAFLKTIQIVLVVIAAGVISSESHQPPPPNNMCYKERPSLYGPAALRYQHTMVDATGQKCYKTLSNRQMTTMLAKTWLNELSANASAEVCPGWSNSKKCLFNHLDTRCNSTQAERFHEDFIFNYFLTAAELLCEPSENFNLLNFLKETGVDGGFGDCISSPDAKSSIGVCVMRFLKRKAIYEIVFTEAISSVHQCYIQPIKNCSQGNIVKELHLLAQSAQLQQARLASYNAVWSQYKTPASPLQDLHNLLK